MEVKEIITYLACSDNLKSDGYYDNTNKLANKVEEFIETDKFLYINFPSWSYKYNKENGDWLRYFPIRFLNNDIEEKEIDIKGYLIIYNLIKNHIDYSFTELISTGLKKIPKTLIFEKGDKVEIEITDNKIKVTFKSLFDYDLNQFISDFECNLQQQTKYDDIVLQGKDDFKYIGKYCFKDDLLTILNDFKTKSLEDENFENFKNIINETKQLDEQVFLLEEFPIKIQSLYFLLQLHSVVFKNFKGVLIIPSKLTNEPEKEVGYGGMIGVFNKDFQINDNIDNIWLLINFKYKEWALRDWIEKTKYDLFKQQLRTAIISILIDSFAHNISAHSLQAIEQWLRKRTAALENRIYINANPQDIPVLPEKIQGGENLKKIGIQAATYYTFLELDDHSNTDEFITINDILKFSSESFKPEFKINQPDLKQRDSNNLSKQLDQLVKGEDIPLPLPNDFLMAPYFRFLKNKGAFWSGVTRDTPFGGSQLDLYSVFYNEIILNPLYMGTIAATEKVNKINFRIIHELKGCSENKQKEILDFFRIDLSEVIEKGTGNSSNTSPLCNVFGEATQDHLKNKKKGINYTDLNHSPLSIIHFGKDFQNAAMVLKKARVFFPGGDIGVHALLTILENTIRNVKHYEESLGQIQESGLDIIITLQEIDLFNIKPGDVIDFNNEKYTGQSRLYRIGIGFGHEVNNASLDFYKRFVERYIKPVVDEQSGKARLGGASQDKICAAQLFNNRFNHVETIGNARDAFVYPWVHPKLITSDDLLKLNTFDHDKSANCRYLYLQNIGSDWSTLVRENYIKHVCPENANFRNNEPKYFFKFFNLWKSQEVYHNTKSVSDEKNSLEQKFNQEFENSARFKYLVVDSFEEYFERFQKGDEDRMVYRVLEESYPENVLNEITNFAQTRLFNAKRDYFKKLRYNILIGIINDEKLRKEWSYQERVNKLMFGKWGVSIVEHENPNNKKFYAGSIGINQIFDQTEKEIAPACFLNFLHKSTDRKNSDKIVYFRSHGILNKVFLIQRNNPFYGILEHKLNEFSEIVLTNICIIDNRVKLLLNKYENANLRLEMLNINFLEENQKIDLSTNELILSKRFTVFVVHLSFIESLYTKTIYANGPKIDWFIKNIIGITTNGSDLYYKFLLCVISGRGNSEWIETDVKEFKAFVIFRPIESILNTIEDELKFEDDFNIKYSLVKLLIG